MLPPFEYLSPRNIEELAAILASYGQAARILAGGTDLLVQIKERRFRPEYIIDIGALKDLCGIACQQDRGLMIRAGTKIETLEKSLVIREQHHALYQAARELGSAQVRAMATLGGNICNASPAAETLPPLVALDARVVLNSLRGRREVPLREFVLGPGETALLPDEFLESVLLPGPAPRSASRFSCLGLREAMEIDIASVAVYLSLDHQARVKDARIVLGAVAPVPCRVPPAEEMLAGELPDDRLAARVAEACAAEARPIDDLRASSAYRQVALKALARRTLLEAAAAARDSSGSEPSPVAAE